MALNLGYLHKGTSLESIYEISKERAMKKVSQLSDREKRYHSALAFLKENNLDWELKYENFRKVYKIVRPRKFRLFKKSDVLYSQTEYMGDLYDAVVEYSTILEFNNIVSASVD